MKITFRCKQSGNCVSFTNEVDIEAMRKEPHYEEVKDAVQIEKTNQAAASEVKKRGRPAKVEEII